MSFNTWNVSYSTILHFGGLLERHGNVARHSRSKDILFFIETKRGASFNILLTVQYSLSQADIVKAVREFPSMNIIITCGNWNRYTTAAKEYGKTINVGVFSDSELLGALWLDNPIVYVKKDDQN